MKIYLTIIFLAGSVIFQAGCSGSVRSSNENLSNLNSNTAVVIPAVENPPAVEPVQPETVQTFTDAGEALAAGSKYLDDSKTENAIDALRQAAKLNPELAEAHFKLGIAYSLQEKEDEALQKVTEETTPTPKATKSKKGKEYVAPITSNSGKSFENAAKAYEKLSKKNPKDDDAFFNLGRAYNKINRDKEAEKALRQPLKLKADDTEYQTELGAILNKLAQYDEAVTVLKKAQERDPENLRTADLLEKAEAGKKRTNFGIKPKLPTDASRETRLTRGVTRRKEESGRTETAPAPKDPPPAPTKP